jgi:RNA polymerase sigma-70 factor (ECF subfamily)
MRVSQSESFIRLLTELRQGDEQAAAEVFERYTRRLIGLARSRLDQRIAARVEADDVVQSVYGSFFRRVERGEFDLEGWTSLWALLAQITIFKCNRQVVFHRAQKRDLRRDQPGSDGPEANDRFEPFSRDPSPEEVLALTELLESLLRGLPEQYRQIVSLRLAGHTPPEISSAAQVSSRTVERVIRLVKDHLQEQLASTQE